MLARNVYLSFGDLDVTLSDNYFDLIPGEQGNIQLTTTATLPQLQQALKVKSLSDAFFDERPSYREHADTTRRAIRQDRRLIRPSPPSPAGPVLIVAKAQDQVADPAE